MSRNKLDSFKLKARRLAYKLRHDVFVAENTALILAVIFCLVLTFNSINAMSRNWTLMERLGEENRKLQLISIEVDTLELENDYYRTEEYQELAARKLANKQFPGEHMIYLPQNSDYAKKKHTEATVAKTEQEMSNFRKWLKFLFPNT